uniref:Uncharacterized protein n=1 Tax=Moniliophthora roreri TaxID=221103 RepID=A0A0W0GDP2_MONRR
MFSLERISTSTDPNVTLERYSLISRDDSWAVSQITRFEWIFGLDYRRFPFESEHNVLPVPKDLIPLLEKRYLMFAPVTAAIHQAFDMIKYNGSVKALKEGRRRYTEFGEGPWEYVLFPGKYPDESRQARHLPPLFYHSPDGNTHSLELDASDFAKFPRISLKIHPTVAIFFVKLQPPDAIFMPPSLRENALIPLLRVVAIWPLWTHNRFLSDQTSSKRKRSESADSSRISCHCTECLRDQEPSSSSSSSASDGSETFASDEEPVAHDAEDDRKFTPSIVAWRGKVVLPAPSTGSDYLDDVAEDDQLLAYVQESALDPQYADEALEEENRKRATLAGPALGNFQCRYSAKRSRRS